MIYTAVNHFVRLAAEVSITHGSMYPKLTADSAVALTAKT